MFAFFSNEIFWYDVYIELSRIILGILVLGFIYHLDSYWCPGAMALDYSTFIFQGTAGTGSPKTSIRIRRSK